MTNLRQSIYTNPARMQDCGFSFSFPMLNINTTTYLSSLNVNNLFSKDNQGKYYLDLEKIVDNSAQFNYLYNSNQFSIFSFGIRFGYPFYFHYDQSLKTVFYFNYPQGVVNFLATGISLNNPNFVLTDLNLSTMIYRQSAFTLGYKVSKDLTLGLSIKRLTGLGLLKTNSFTLDVAIDTTNDLNYPMDITSQYDFYYSGPVGFSYADSLIIDTNSALFALDGGVDAQTLRNLLMPKNHGWALDLGFVYNPIKYLEISGSIVDLGYIKWKTNSKHVYHQESSLYIDGIDIINDTNAVENFVDTLKTLFVPQIEDGNFSSGINTRIYLGLAFKPVDYLSLGLAYQTVKLQPKNWMNIYHFSAALNLGYTWSFTGTYSIYPHSYNNFGLGATINLGFIQFYIITDNLALPNFGISYFTNRDTPPEENSATLWLKKAQLVNFHFGINFNFGCKDRLDYGILD